METLKKAFYILMGVFGFIIFFGEYHNALPQLIGGAMMARSLYKFRAFVFQR